MSVRTSEGSLFRKASAWIPIAMSLSALTFLLIYAAIFGTRYHADERWPARIFQLVMLAELPIAAFFAVKWLPKQPRQSLIVLAAQAIAWIIPIATVLLLESK
jgi:hypothetical protein